MATYISSIIQLIQMLSICVSHFSSKVHILSKGKEYNNEKNNRIKEQPGSFTIKEALTYYYFQDKCRCVTKTYRQEMRGNL